MEREREREVGFTVWQAMQSRKKDIDKYNKNRTVQRGAEHKEQKTYKLLVKHKQACLKTNCISLPVPVTKPEANLQACLNQLPNQKQIQACLHKLQTSSNCKHPKLTCIKPQNKLKPEASLAACLYPSQPVTKKPAFLKLQYQTSKQKNLPAQQTPTSLSKPKLQQIQTSYHNNNKQSPHRINSKTQASPNI